MHLDIGVPVCPYNSTVLNTGTNVTGEGGVEHDIKTSDAHMVNVRLKSTMFGHVFCLKIWLCDERVGFFFFNSGWSR